MKIVSIFAVCVVGFLLLPVVLTIWISFSPDSFLTPPRGEWSIKWYREFFSDPRWQNGVANSLTTAIASATLAVVLGVPLSYSMSRGTPRYRRTITTLVFLPMVLPPVAFGLGLLGLYAILGLVGSSLSLILTHGAISLPVVCLLLGNHFGEIPPELELAAAGLGASRGQILRRVIIPILRPTILASFLAAMVISWNESLLTILLAGPQSETLPAIVWPQLRFAASPLVAVASAVSIALAVVGVSSIRRLGRVRVGGSDPHGNSR